MMKHLSFSQLLRVSRSWFSLLLTTLSLSVSAQDWNQIINATASDADGTIQENFGYSVAISGDYAIVGASRKNNERGAAYVFSRTGTNWTQQAILTAPDGRIQDYFGISVSISGDYAIVGAYRALNGDNGRGAAYVYSRTGTSWAQQARLTPSYTGSYNEFGISVSIAGNDVIVGADGENSDTGAAYVFSRTGTTWTEQARLTASDGARNDVFGGSVSLSGDYALVGAYGKNSYTGAAYVFSRTGTTWTEQAKLTASDGTTADYYGYSVSLSGDYALVGAYRKSSNRGAAYVYDRTGTSWSQQAILTASDRAPAAGFGIGVSILGSRAIVGSEGRNDFRGAAYVFSRTGTGWSEQTILTASDEKRQTSFGCSVSLSGDYALVGARLANPLNLNLQTGSAYLFGQCRTGLTAQPVAGSVVCAGTTVTASVSTSGTVGGYQWYKGTTPVIDQTTATLSIPSANTVDAGLYSVVVTGGGCSFTSTSFNLTVTVPPSATIAYPGSAFLTSSEPLNVTRTGTADGTYSATPGGLSLNPSTGQITPISSTPGTYTVTYTLTAGVGCPPVTATAILAIQAPPSADLRIAALLPGSTAVPGNTVIFAVPVKNQGPNDAVDVVLSAILPAAVTPIRIVSTPHTGAPVEYPVTGNNIRLELPILTDQTSYGLYVEARIDPASTGTLTFPASITASTTDANPGNNTATASLTLTPQADLSLTFINNQTAVQAGRPLTYTLVVTNSGLSNAPDATVTHTVPATLTGLSWTASSTGGGTLLAASGTGNLNQAVNLPAGGSVSFLITGTLSASATGTLTTSASVTAAAGVADLDETNNSTTHTHAVIPASPTITGFAPRQPVSCAGRPLTFTATVGNLTGAYNFTLTNGQDEPATGTLPPSVTRFQQTVAPSSSGLQSYTLIVSTNGETTSATTTLLINPLPPLSVQTSGPLTCAQTTVNLTASGAGVFTLSGEGVLVTSFTGVFSLSQPGSFTVSLTDGNGCSTWTTTVISQDITPPPVSISPASQTICQGQSVTLTATGASSYSWNNQLTSATVSATATGVYSVTGTASNGCSATATATVTVNPQPVVAIIGLVGAYCQDAAASTLMGTPAGGGTFTIDGTSTSTLTPGSLTIGQHTVVYRYTDGNGCSNSASQTVTVNATPAAPSLLTQGGQSYPASQSAVTVDLNTGNVTLVGSGCAGAVTWSGPNNSAGTGTSISVPTIQAGTFTYQATCTVNGCTSPLSTATVTVGARLTMLHRDVDNYADNNAIQPLLVLQNNSTGSLPLAKLTLRYYLTVEGTATLSNLSTNYAQVGNQNVRLRYIALTPVQQGATGYVEYSFTEGAGSLAAGANSGSIQSYFTKSDYGSLNEPDDYSYNPVRDQLRATLRITAYYDGVLIAGVEPGSTTQIRAVRALTESKNGSSATQINTVLEVRNEGNVSINYSDLSARYYFTADGNERLLVEVDEGNVSTQLVKLSTPVNGADTYLEIRYNQRGQLAAGASTGAIRYRISKPDGGRFNQANDYSYQEQPQERAQNSRVVIYAGSERIWSQEPGGSVRVAFAEAGSGLSVTVLGNPIQNDQVSFEVTGAEGQSLQVQLVTLQGRIVNQQLVPRAEATQRYQLSVAGQAGGLLLLQVSTSTQSQTVKVIKAN